MRASIVFIFGILLTASFLHAAEKESSTPIQREFETDHETLWNALSEVIVDLGMQVRNADKQEDVIETYASPFSESKQDFQNKVSDEKKVKRLPDTVTGNYLLKVTIIKQSENKYLVRPEYTLERWKALRLGGEFEKYLSSGLLENEFLKKLAKQIDTQANVQR